MEKKKEEGQRERRQTAPKVLSVESIYAFVFFVREHILSENTFYKIYRHMCVGMQCCRWSLPMLLSSCC